MVRSMTCLSWQPTPFSRHQPFYSWIGLLVLLGTFHSRQMLSPSSDHSHYTSNVQGCRVSPSPPLQAYIMYVLQRTQSTHLKTHPSIFHCLGYIFHCDVLFNHFMRTLHKDALYWSVIKHQHFTKYQSFWSYHNNVSTEELHEHQLLPQSVRIQATAICLSLVN